MAVAAERTGRRAPGTGCLIVRRDTAGRETWFGKWSVDGQQIKRRVGPKRVTSTRDGMTRTQAEAELRRLMESEKPTRRVGEALTISNLAERYLEHMRRQARKRSTVVAVQSVVRIWLDPYFGDRDLRRVRLEDVRDLVTMMEAGKRPGPRQAGDRRYGRVIAPKTLRNYVGVLSALLAYAEREGMLASNVARGVNLPRVELDQNIRFLEPLEVQALADAAIDGDYKAIDRALYLTAAMTGLRQGELIALRWQDVDWTAGRVRVRQNYVLGEFGTPKSRRSTRSVPLADAVAGELDRLCKASAATGDDDLVFADPFTAGPMSKAAVLRRYRKSLKAAKLDETHVFHDLRHTFGTRMAAAGVPMRTLQEWMGHRDIATTQRYADYAPSAHEAAFVEAAFGTGLRDGTSRGTSLRESTAI